MTSNETGKRQNKPHKRISERLLDGAIWIVVGRIFMAGSMITQIVVLARLLDPAAIGLAAIATSIAFVVEASTKQNLAAALVQHDNVTREHLDTAFTLNLFRGVIIGVVVLAAAYPAAALFDDDRIAPMVIALAISTSVMGISNPNIYTFMRDLVFWQEFARTVAQRLAVVAVSIPVAFYFRSHWAIIAGVAAGQLSLVVSSFFFAPYRPRLCLTKTRELMSFSLWVTLQMMLQAVISRLDRFLVGYFLGNAAVGILTVSSELASAPTKEVSIPVLRTAFPAFVKMKSNPDKLRAAYQRVQSLVFMIAFPLAIGLVTVAEPMVLVMLGDQWIEGIIVVQLLAGTAGLQAMASAIDPLAMAKGQTKSLFLRTFVNTGLRIPMMVTGLLLGGLVGMLIAIMLHSITAISVNMTLVRKILALSYFEQIAANKRAILGSGVMAAAVVGFSSLVSFDNTFFGRLFELACKVSIGGAAFLLSVTVMWKLSGWADGPEKEMLSLGQKLLGKVFKRFAPQPT